MLIDFYNYKRKDEQIMDNLLKMPKAWEFKNASEFSKACQEYRNSEQFKHNVENINNLDRGINTCNLTGDENYDGISLFAGDIKTLLNEVYH